MVKNSVSKLDFVFMATCHSEFAARIFLDAGAHHVIGVNKEAKIADMAVLNFTKTFYSKLWKERSQICKCFETAKLAVEINHGAEEASKFLLFTENGNKHKC